MVIGVAVVGLVLMLALAVGLVGVGVAAHTQVTAAADAAALAAAPVTFRPFGASGSPASEAALFARRNGSVLVSCRCPIDPSWRRRTAVVVVARRLSVFGVGSIVIRAESRATFDPLRLVEPPLPVSG